MGVALLPMGAIAQTNSCNNNTAGMLPVQNAPCTAANVIWFDVDHNNDYWDAATGCGASDVDATWGWFTAVSTSTTITYDPITAGTNPIITIFTGACSTGMTALTCMNGAGANGTETLVLPTTVGTVYRIRVENMGSNSDMTGDLCVYSTVPVPPGTNNTCAAPNPICSGSPIAFIANAGGASASTINPGNNYGCLTTSPNPSWYYMEIDQSGNLAIDITAGSDVDFKLWGPFASVAAAQAACGTYTNAISPDCSYSTSATEQANATVVAGQVWVLLVTNYANTIQTISINEAGSNTASTNCAIVPLPVGYTQWDLHYIDRKVVLTWATETEQNNKHFLVQRSSTGTVWETIGVVAGNGDSQQAHNYQYIDEKPKSGISYYRLMQVDFNGTPSYTSILSVNTDKAERFGVYPNPAKNSFNVLAGQKNIEKLVISNAVGQSFEVTYTESADGLTVDCSHLAPGLYTLTLISGSIVQSERLVIRE